MREDGCRVDKIMLTTNSSYTPSGTGPSESSRSGGDTTPPKNVTTLTAINWGSDGHVRLSWTASESADTVYYKVYRSLTSGFTPSGANLIGNVSAGPGTNYYYDLDDSLNGTGLVTYYYVVRAVDDSNNTATGGNQFGIKPRDIVFPEGVNTFEALSHEDGSITLVWTAATPPDFYAYYIYRIEASYPIGEGFPPEEQYLVQTITDNNTLTWLDNESNLHRGLWSAYKIFVADEVGYDDNKYMYAYNLLM